MTKLLVNPFSQKSTFLLWKTATAITITLTLLTLYSILLPHPNLKLDFKDSIVAQPSEKLYGSQVAMVTYYKRQSLHFQDSYFSFMKYSLTNINDYCQHHGIPFFFNNARLVDPLISAYWSKMAVINHYFKFGYKWIIWTDVDVLFWNKQRSILDLWIQKAQDRDKHVALVTECSLNGNQTDFGPVRSGFLAFRNSEIGKSLLASWVNTFALFKDEFNPEQEALEQLIKLDSWKNVSYIAPPDGIHTYGECQSTYDFNVTSVHYPDTRKSNIIADAKKLNVDMSEFVIAMEDL